MNALTQTSHHVTPRAAPEREALALTRRALFASVLFLLTVVLPYSIGSDRFFDNDGELVGLAGAVMLFVLPLLGIAALLLGGFGWWTERAAASRARRLYAIATGVGAASLCLFAATWFAGAMQWML
jgi:hypothetical protein